MSELTELSPQVGILMELVFGYLKRLAQNTGRIKRHGPPRSQIIRDTVTVYRMVPDTFPAIVLS